MCRLLIFLSRTIQLKENVEAIRNIPVFLKKRKQNILVAGLEA